ncbi:MAG: IclR family transcriptional regulator [Lachnospiraceae bacterium]|nr:IclR family transcriptional regulator [Lachnospiraceae bacterium]
MSMEKDKAGIVVPENVKVKSLYKAIMLLFYFSEEDRELGITELAEKSGLLKSSIYNMLSTYEACGLVKRNPFTNKYYLGVRVLELSNQFYRNNDLRQVVKPHMEQIANETGETVFLGVLNGTEVIYLDAAFPDSSTGGRNMTGLKAPLYCTGIGKAMLAFESEEKVDEVIRNGMEPFTENTIVDGEQLRKELALIRERGYATDNMEHEYGIKCVAMPIRNADGKVVASCSVTGPSLRFKCDKMVTLAAILKKHAELLKDRI